MTIEKIEIASFGGMENREFLFKEGVNILEGENESGKSRIAAFIRFIFYGFSGEPEKEKYAVEGKAAGKMTLSCAKGQFSVERRVGTTGKGGSVEDVDIVDLRSGQPIRGKDPAGLFLGVDRNTFEQSLLLAQMSSHAISPLQMEKAVENLLASADESVNAGESIGRLAEEIRQLKGEETEEGRIPEQRRSLALLKERLEKAVKEEAEYEKTAVSLKENMKKAESNKKEWAEYQRLVEHTDALRKLERIKRTAGVRDRQSTIEKELDALQKEQGYRGFLPKKEYAQQLQALWSEVSAKEERIKEKQEERLQTEEMLEKLPDLPKGEEGNLLSAIQKCIDRASASRQYLIIAGAGAAFALILCSIFSIMGKLVPGILFGVLTLTAIGAMRFFWLRFSQAKKKEQQLYDSVGAENREELAEAVERHTALRLRREALEKSIEGLEHSISKEKDSLEAVLEKAKELSGLWGKTVNTPKDLEKLVRQSSEVSRRYEELMAEEKQVKLELSALDMTVSETELKHLLAVARQGGGAKELTPEEYKNAVMKVNFYKQTSQALEDRTEKQKKQLTAMEEQMEDSFELEQAVARAEAELQNLEERLRVIEHTKAAFEKSVAYMRNRILPGISSDASAFFEKATAGRYRGLEVDQEFRAIAVHENGERLPVASLSGGMAELAYLAVRISITDRLFGEQTVPMIFDESFAYLDDFRQAAAFSALAERVNSGRMQMFFLTCRKRETALMERITTVHRISLGAES